MFSLLNMEHKSATRQPDKGRISRVSYSLKHQFSQNTNLTDVQGDLMSRVAVLWPDHRLNLKHVYHAK